MNQEDKVKLIVGHAENLGFICQLTDSNKWQITSSRKKETWKLVETENKWILYLKDIPQINLSHSETLRFLEHRSCLPK